MENGSKWDHEVRRLSESPFRLRFELGGDMSNVTHPVPRFIQAFDRARDVAEGVFASFELFAVVGVPISECGGVHPEGDGFGALRNLGFDANIVSEWQASRHRGDGACWWKCFEIGHDRRSRDALLWCSISAEMAVEPKAAVTVYLVEPARRVLLHVYDDRGMDLYAASPDALTATYLAFDQWLLDYDRPRMAEAFGMRMRKP